MALPAEDDEGGAEFPPAWLRCLAKLLSAMLVIVAAEGKRGGNGGGFLRCEVSGEVRYSRLKASSPANPCKGGGSLRRLFGVGGPWLPKLLLSLLMLMLGLVLPSLVREVHKLRLSFC